MTMAITMTPQENGQCISDTDKPYTQHYRCFHYFFLGGGGGVLCGVINICMTEYRFRLNQKSITLPRYAVVSKRFCHLHSHLVCQMFCSFRFMLCLPNIGS